MFKDAFYKLDEVETQAILRETAPFFEGMEFEPAATALLAYDLAFYPGFRLIDIIRRDSIPPLRRLMVFKSGSINVLNWTNEPIYHLNRIAPLYLTASNAPDYVRFFFACVRGRHGAFQIVESASDILWREEPPASARKAISRLIQPVQVIADSGNGAYSLFSCMMFKDALFRVTVHVTRNGEITLKQEELIAEDMPVRDEVTGI